METFKGSFLSTAQNNDLMELLPKILNVKAENFKITPSEYIKEMSITSEERHQKLIHTANMKKLLHNTNPLNFKLLPNIIIFQKFEPRTTQCLTLEIKNIGKTLLPLKMFCPDSTYFFAKHAGTPTNKLAPGLSVEYEVVFTPREARDYNHHLVFKSKEDTFHVPIVAIGPRPMLDIPDQIILNTAPVKLPMSKIIIVRNIGDAPAVYNFIIDRKFFKISPTKGVLGIHESMMLNISFESSKVGEVTEHLYLSLETGEKLITTLHGSAENIAVRLDKNLVIHDDTYMGLKRCKSLNLTNNSSHIVKFSWKKHSSQEEDLNVLESLKSKCKSYTDMAILKDAKIIYYGLGKSETHKLSCERILKDELQLLEKEEFNFTSDVFTIVPQV